MGDEFGSIEDAAPRSDMNKRVWFACAALITVVAAFVRFYDLALKALHHDEGVNGFFLKTLYDSGAYKYDPANYHGPTLYYIAAGFAKVFGLETVPVRASVAIFGVLAVILVFYFRNYIGSVGSLAAGLLIALSPGLVFISRYFIHETFFVFLGLAFVLSIVLFLEKRPAGFAAIFWIVLVLLVCFLPSTLNLSKAIGGTNTMVVWSLRLGLFLIESVLVYFVVRMLVVWNEGRPIYLLLASACAALLFATKETAFITLGVMAISCVCVVIWSKLSRNFDTVEPAVDDHSSSRLTWKSFNEALGTDADKMLIAAAATLIFVYIFVLFFSSFFTYAEGIKGAFDAYTIWTKTGSKDHTQNGMWAYFYPWGLIEAPIFILSALGAIIALAKAKHRFAVFAAFWAFGVLGAYTLIPYKTPWLALSFLLPMCIVAGYGINEIAARRNVGFRIVAALLSVAAAGFLGYRMYELNFVRYDDNDMTYVYAHTKRGFLDLISKVDHYAEKSGKGHDAEVQIVSPDYWPMVWYLKDYTRANFYGHMVDAGSAEMIIAKKDDQDAEVIRKFSAGYDYAGTYPLRPGVDLVLLVRKNIADTDAKPLYVIEHEP
ncbi:MAG: glycosyltransferase family 39 protein [Acidobacteriota bacterium]